MALVNAIDSNRTGLSFAEEAGQKVLPTPAQVWYFLEPNEYTDFGGSVTTVARNPINAARQRKKGLATDLDASGGFSTDLTQTNLERLFRGFFFANYREKPDTQAYSSEATYTSTGALNTAADPITITNVSTTDDSYNNTGDDFTAAPGGFLANDLVFASGFTNTGNNGLKTVATIAALKMTVSENLVDEASPPAAGRLVHVGHQFAAGDLDVDASSGFTKLTTASKDLTQLGLIPGEWIFIGGDAANTSFTNAVNNGFKRVRSVSANEIVIDKSDQDMVTEASTTETVQIFFGRVIKNEADPDLIIERSYQLQRTLGANNDTDLTRQQAEYLEGAFANELTLNVGTADKVTADLTFIALDSSTIDENISGADTIKSDLGTATKISIAEADAFNTSSDVKRTALTTVVDGDEAPPALFAFLQEFTLAINNNVTPLKAIGTFGAFDVTLGDFIVDANATAYFADVAAITAVRNTTDVSLDFHFVKSNAGMSFDIPLITLGDGRPNVTKDESITIPLTNAAADGAKVDSTLNHTLLLSIYDYLPNAADT